MNRTNRQVEEMYPESDAASKRSLEELAHAIGHFRAAVHHVADKNAGPELTVQTLEKAQRRSQSVARRRVMLEWAVAAVVCITMLIPAVGYYRNHSGTGIQEAQQPHVQQAQQRQADELLLEQVSSEISEAVPDSMQPLTGLDPDDSVNQAVSPEMERKNVRK